MGEAMAERLLAAGVGVQAWNRTPDKVAGLLAQGATPLASPALSEAPVAFSMVLNDEALDRLGHDDDGILAGARPPGIWVDCSTVSPEASERAARAAAPARGTAFVCAPVSGNPLVVRSGNLIFAVSGPPAAVAAATPLLSDIGRGVHVVGEAHEARVVKLCTNLVLAVLTQALAEALVLGQVTGCGGPPDGVHQRQRDRLPVHRYKTDAFVRLDLAPRSRPRASAKTSGSPSGWAPSMRCRCRCRLSAEVESSLLVASGLGADLSTSPRSSCWPRATRAW